MSPRRGKADHVFVRWSKIIHAQMQVGNTLYSTPGRRGYGRQVHVFRLERAIDT